MYINMLKPSSKEERNKDSYYGSVQQLFINGDKYKTREVVH